MGQQALPRIAVPARPVLRPAAAAGLAATAVGLAYAALSAPLPTTATVWGGAALAAWCGALLTGCSMLAGRKGLGLAQWKLGSWFLAYCVVVDGLASMSRSGMLPLILPSNVARAEWLTAVGLTAWAAGYAARPRRLTAGAAGRCVHTFASRRSDLVRSPMTPWLLYAAGAAARVASAVLLGHLGYAVGNPTTAVSSAVWYQQPLSDTALACPLAVLVAGLRAFREKSPGARVTLAVLLAAEVAASLVMGSKGQFIIAVVAVAIARESAGLRVSARFILSAVAIALVFVIPFTAAYRAQVRNAPATTASGQPNTDLGPRQAVAAAPILARSTISATSLDTIWSSLSYLTQRLSDIAGPALVLQETPSQIPYASPTRIPETLAADLVPRVLWPGKPLGETGLNFTRQYYASNVVTASAITPQGDLYRYGGWLTVLAGMAGLGYLTRVVDDVLDIRTYGPAALLVLLLWPTLADPEGSFTATLAVLPGLVITWLVVTVAAFRPAAAR